MKETAQEKPLEEVLAPIVGLPPSQVGERLKLYGETATAELTKLVRSQSDKATIFAAFNQAAVFADRKLVEEDKAVVGPEPALDVKGE